MVEDTKENMSLTNVRVTTACLLGFSGFLQFDKIAKIRPVDLTIDEKLTIQIRQSKTGQLRKGSELVISRTSSTCLVNIFKNCLKLGGIQLSNSRLLFGGRSLVKIW